MNALCVLGLTMQLLLGTNLQTQQCLEVSGNEIQSGIWKDTVVQGPNYTMYDGLTGKYGVYFPCDGETVYVYADDKDMRFVC